ncbi:MAG TPA: PGPGW domain-containing protein [Azospirillaceae bacterium]|nr:PGPGW domain-containing protein [Azospirillaceae bacterium]
MTIQTPVPPDRRPGPASRVGVYDAPHAPASTRQADGPADGQAGGGRPLWVRWLKLAAGYAFLVLGVAGLVLPFLQGILFLLIGLSILATEQAWAHRLVERVRARYPGLSARVDEARARATAWWRRR